MLKYLINDLKKIGNKDKVLVFKSFLRLEKGSMGKEINF
jgi:hypothetical protein